MRNLVLVVCTVALCGVAFAGCTIDARDDGEDPNTAAEGAAAGAGAGTEDAAPDSGTTAPDAGATADAGAAPVTCVHHSDCVVTEVCRDGSCVAPSAASDAGSADAGVLGCTPTDEVCNGRDDDCDGVVDEGCPPAATDAGTGGVTDGGADSGFHAAGDASDGGAPPDGGADGGPIVPPSGTVTLRVACPTDDAACVLSAWWGPNRRADQVSVLLLTLDFERCQWGVDLNARRGGSGGSSGGSWYSDPVHLMRLLVTVDGEVVVGTPVSDFYGFNLYLTPFQLRCESGARDSPFVPR